LGGDAPQTTPDVLVQLIGDMDMGVRRVASEHPNLPEQYRMFVQLA